MQHYEQASSFSAKLLSFFEENASACGMAINPTVLSDHDAEFFERIYEEERDDRIIIISPHSNPKLDVFSKKTGLNYEKCLLQIYTNLDGEKLPTLWGAYKMWIHDRADQEAILRYIHQSRQ